MTFWERQNYVDIKNIIDFQGLGNASLMAQWVKNLPANAGDTRDEGSISGSGRSPGKGNGTTIQYLGWKILQTRGVWRTTVHGATKRD